VTLDALALLLVVAVAIVGQLVAPRAARWWHRRSCERCARVARRGTVLWP
jgi:hypothetical protein